MKCPKCGSENVQVNTFQEQKSSITAGTTVITTPKKHGCFYWLLIGWWIWIFKILFFPITLIVRAIKKRHLASAHSVSTTKNSIGYKTVCTCQNCGYRWES